MSELRITFLGTSSGRPTPRRGVASVFLQYGAESVLFDCGEGTQLQALKASVRPSRLRAICISHYHGDHVNGLPGFLGTLGLNGHREKMVIAAPRGLDRYLSVLRDLSILHPAFEVEHVLNSAGEVFRTPDFAITTCKLDHRIPTYAFLFKEHDLTGRFDLDRARELGVPAGPLFGQLQRGNAVTLADGRVVQPSEVLGPTRRGRSIAYVTDTRPTPAAAELARGADILIHEATYLHELREQAVERKHATVREAAIVAADAGVKRLILTHISPKHTSTREILTEARSVFPESYLAEDFQEYELPVPA